MDEEFYNSMIWLKENKVTAELGLTFTVIDKSSGTVSRIYKIHEDCKKSKHTEFELNIYLSMNVNALFQILSFRTSQK